MSDKISIENAKVTDKGVELKKSAAGKDYAAFTVMWSSSRKGQSGDREYGPTKFVKVKVFGFAANDVAANVQGGDRVNVSGNIENFTWESNNGPKDDWSLFAESVSLPVPRANQQQSQGGGFGGGQQSQGGFQSQQPPQPQQGGFSQQQGYNPQQAAPSQGGFQPQQHQQQGVWGNDAPY